MLLSISISQLSGILPTDGLSGNEGGSAAFDREDYVYSIRETNQEQFEIFMNNSEASRFHPASPSKNPQFKTGTTSERTEKLKSQLTDYLRSVD